jgi:hypothetical protein
MKFKSLCCVLAAIFITTLGYSQGEDQGKQITVTGKVIDAETSEPLEFATLVLESTDDPNIVTGGITNQQGEFSVDAPSGNYNIRVEFISYRPYTLNNQSLTKDRNLGTIELTVDVAELDAVEIVGEKTTVEVRLDKKVYNLGKDLTTSGATVTDALNNVPSVTVDVEGAISLRGNENVRILINGKPSAMAGFGSTDALKQLPADAIEKVEVITSPSARYDAEGTAGILNIVLKKEKTLGFNGSVSVTTGYPATSRISANLNLRTDKFNIFTTLGHFYREPPGQAHFDNRYFGESVFDRVTEDREMMRKDNGFNANLGMEYFLTDRSSITASVFTRLSDEEDHTKNTTSRYIGSDIDSRTLREELEKQDDKSYQISLNYTNHFNDEGHKLTADFQYSTDDETNNTNIDENQFFPTDQYVDRERVFETDVEDEYLVQVDYVLPMGEAQFEAGYRGDFEHTENDYELARYNTETGEFDTDYGLTNVFDYEENVNAVYAQYGNKFGKFSFLLGLRLENTQLKGKVTSDLTDEQLIDTLGFEFDPDFDKNYLELFPTVNLTYELGENENISLGYNRRINRPRGWFINPFPSRSSRTNIFQGNPDLNPAFADAFDLGYLKRWEDLTLTSSVYYQRETESFDRVQRETGRQTSDGIDIISTIPINLSTNQRYGGEVGLMYGGIDWLQLNGSFNLFKSKTDGEYEGVDYSADNTSWFSRLSAKVELPARVDWQTNAFYMGPRENSQTKSDGMLSVDMALSKDIMGDNATISMNVSDLLNTRKRNSYTRSYDEFGDLSFTSDSEFQWRERQFTISFVYRFNQPKNGRANRPNNNNMDDDNGGGFQG